MIGSEVNNLQSHATPYMTVKYGLINKRVFLVRVVCTGRRPSAAVRWWLGRGFYWWLFVICGCKLSDSVVIIVGSLRSTSLQS